ncbi:MAG: hypothetical protein IJ398_04290 [Clostridia bacterium]|nr:hypothetical protein [Clostridia bacterium]
MTKNELYSKSFDVAIEELCWETDGITSYEVLKEFAKEKIEDENLLIAIHILKAIQYNYSEYYAYDYTMGTLDTPKPLRKLEDLELFCFS